MSDETAQGIFANLAVMNHTESEFVMDFVYLQPNAPRGKVRSRIIMTPEQLKKFNFALQDNIQKYEKNYGKIKLKENSFKSRVTDITAAKSTGEKQ